jgi:hypothetical protein
MNQKKFFHKFAEYFASACFTMKRQIFFPKFTFHLNAFRKWFIIFFKEVSYNVI